MKQKYFLTVLLSLSALFGVFGQCPSPTVPSVTMITETSATFSWSFSGSETQWEVLVLPAGTPEPNAASQGIMANSNPFMMTGLVPCTSYKYYVRTNCSPGVFSGWTGPVNFTTATSGNCSFTVSIVATQDIPTSSLFAEVFNGTPPFSFQWFFNGNVLPGAINQNLDIMGQSGLYSVTVTDSNNATTTASIQIEGISITAMNDTITAYPNSNTTTTSPSVLANDFMMGLPIYPSNTGNVILTPSALPSGFSFNPNGTVSILPGTAAGTYILTYMICAVQSPTACSTATATITVANEGLLLKAFIDTNTNGTQDSGEANFNLGQFQYQLNNNGVTNTVASSNGSYYIQESNASTTYDLSFVVDSNYSSYYTVSPSSYNDISFVPGSGVMVFNFPITEIPYSDAEISLIPNGAPPRPGFTYTNLIAYKNSGNLPIASGTVTFNNSNTVAITTISQTGTTPTATGFTYDFTNLLPNEIRYILVTMQVPTIPTVALGDLITNTASITIPATDVTVSNNHRTLTQTIVGSYDPNDKTESHGEKIVHSSFGSNDYLTYTIQFENTGTYGAENVKITDVLDAKLDETSVKMMNASHSYILNRINNTLNWNLNGIDLAPSGKGQVTFQVKPKPDYAIGDVIPNTAYIYFDFNPAIVTNTFETEFVSTMSVSEFKNAAFLVYPNPTNGTLHIASKDNAQLIETVTVNDISGKTIRTITVNTSSTSIDVSDLASGMYFAKVKSERGENVVKIIRK